jgi:pimeloyl-ACP methyl ester carboxylesterase
VILPEARHPAYLDQPEKFHRALLEFLAGLDG